MFKKRQSPTKNVSIVAAKLTKYRCCRNCGGKLSRISVENMLQSDVINLNPYDSLYTAKSNPPITTLQESKISLILAALKTPSWYYKAQEEELS